MVFVEVPHPRTPAGESNYFFSFSKKQKTSRQNYTVSLHGLSRKAITKFHTVVARYTTMILFSSQLGDFRSPIVIIMV